MLVSDNIHTKDCDMAVESLCGTGIATTKYAKQISRALHARRSPNGVEVKLDDAPLIRAHEIIIFCLGQKLLLCGHVV